MRPQIIPAGPKPLLWENCDLAVLSLLSAISKKVQIGPRQRLLLIEVSAQAATVGILDGTFSGLC